MGVPTLLESQAASFGDWWGIILAVCPSEDLPFAAPSPDSEWGGTETRYGSIWVSKWFFLVFLLCTQISSSSVHLCLKGLSLSNLSLSSQWEQRFQIVRLDSFAMPLIHSHSCTFVPKLGDSSQLSHSALTFLHKNLVIAWERVGRGCRLPLLMGILRILKHHTWPLKILVYSSSCLWQFSLPLNTSSQMKRIKVFFFNLYF